MPELRFSEDESCSGGRFDGERRLGDGVQKEGGAEALIFEQLTLFVCSTIDKITYLKQAE